MRTICSILTIVVIAFMFAAPAKAQYGDEPYIEGTIGGNLTLPMGHIKNDLEPDSLNAGIGLGFDASAGYYWKPQLIIGGYFSMRNMGVEEFDLIHRGWEIGIYGKYLLFDLSEKSVSPYLKASVGLAFNKFATKVLDDETPKYRELSYDPVPAGELALGTHIKTNSKGGLYLEAAYHFDKMDGVAGEYEGVEYDWPSNANYIIFRLGVLFNIGRGD